ncbi:retrovirus-related pol polyprotein from transposon TNT 1-94 [Tanacetum coccineum]
MKPRNPQHVTKCYETCSSTVHPTTDHNDIEWFRRGEALQAKKVESSNANRSKTPTKRHMTGVKSYLHKSVEQPGPKVVFRDDSTCTTEGYGSIKCNDATRTMLLGFVFSKQYCTEAVATACYTQNRSTIVKRHFKTPYEILHGRLPNINFLHVFGCPIFIHNHKNHLRKFDEKADDGYFLGYSLISKALRVFNTRRQQTEETFHVTFDESTEAIKFSKPSIDAITIAASERYPPDEYLHHFEPSQRYLVDSNVVQFIEPYKRPVPIIIKAGASIDQNNQADKNDPSFESSEFLNHVCKLDKALYGLKQAPRACENSNGTPNYLGPDLNGKFVNETQYRGIIGSLMYLIASRPDIQFSTCLYARYQANPKESYLIVVNRILRKSTSGACHLLGGKLSQLSNYDIVYEKVPIFCDNTSAIAISNNPALHSRTKHIDISYHFTRYRIIRGDIELHFIPTQYQLANIFTKPLEEPTFKRLIIKLGTSDQGYWRLTLEGFPFVTVNTKEYHSECSGKISRIMRRTL